MRTSHIVARRWGYKGSLLAYFRPLFLIAVLLGGFAITFPIFAAPPSVSFSSDDFVITVKTDNLGPSGDDQFTIPTYQSDPSLTYNYNVDCNDDGSFEATAQGGNYTCNYSAAGIYTIRIRDNSGARTGFPRIYFNDRSLLNDTDSDKLLSVAQWGIGQWDSMNMAFAGCTNMNITASDVPDLSNVSDMEGIFYEAWAMNANLNGWDVSNVTNMKGAFFFATTFNQPLNTWNTANVTDMNNMFAGAEAFNQNIATSGNNWNTAAVTDMGAMFKAASAFNQNIGNWDTSSVENMAEMFSDEGFSMPTAFNQNIGSWVTSSVKDMSGMFWGAENFNQDLNNWNTAAVTDMASMFEEASVFNGNVSSWVTSSVTDMSGMFASAEAFNQNITGWNTANVTNMAGMFSGAEAFNQNISTNGNNWNTAAVTDMNSMFDGAILFNQNIGNWNTAAVTDMSGMFADAAAFDQDISGWSTGNVTDMGGMFFGATAFDQNLNTWNTAAVTNMYAMFQLATSFNRDLNNWNTAAVQDMSTMFFGASAFDGNISTWNTAAVTDMSAMFAEASAFNQNISTNGNIWNTAAVTDMRGMFGLATTFNQDIGNWNTAAVTDMGGMFNGAAAFNRDLSGWNTGAVTDMSDMFNGATAFDQNVAGWNVSSIGTGSAFNPGDLTSMFEGATLSTDNYDALLIGWEAQSVQSGLDFHGGSSTYCNGETARNNLINSDGWSITDGNKSCTAGPVVQSVSSPATNGFFYLNDTINITVTFSEVVNVTGTPQLKLETGDVDRVVDYTTGTGTDTLTFSYTVQNGDSNPDLDYYSTAMLIPNGGTIQNAGGDDAYLTLPAPGTTGSLSHNKDLFVDTVPPTLDSFARQTPATSPTNADTLTFRATFDEDVQNVDITDFEINGGSTADVSNVTPVGGASVYDLTVSGGDLANFNGTVGLDLAATQDISDLIGFNLPAGEPATDETYSLDNTAPTPTISATQSDPTNADPINFSVDFGEEVTGFETGDLTIGNGGAPTNFATSDDQTYTFDISPTADGAVTVNIAGGVSQDLAGNNNAAAQFSITSDQTAPAAPGEPDLEAASDSGPSPNDNITNVNTPQFTGSCETDATVTLSSSSQGALAPTQVCSGSQYDITLTTTLNDGTHDITAAQVDAAGNPGPASSALSVTIETDPPAVVSITASPTQITDSTAGTDTFTVTTVFDETMATGTTPVLTFAPDVAAGATPTLSNGSGAWSTTTLTDDTFTMTYDVTDRNIDIDSVTIDVSGATDLLGNSQDDYTPVHEFEIDTQNPTVISVTSTTPDGAYTVGAIINLTLNFSEPVTIHNGAVTLSHSAGAPSIDIFGFSNTSTPTGSFLVRAGQNTPDLDATNLWAWFISGWLRDAAGNDAIVSLPATTIADGSDIVIDTTAPTIQSITSNTSNGAYKVGDPVDVTVNFSEIVSLSGGTLDVTLDTGDVVSIAAFTDANTASGTYTVGAGDTSADLDSTAITLSGGTLRDRAENDVTVSLPATTIIDLKDIVIDTTAPAIQSITSNTPDGTYRVWDTVDVTVTFSENVTLSGGTLDVTLDTGDVVSIAAFNDANTASGTYTVRVGDSSADLDSTGISLSGGTLQDAAGHAVPVSLPATTIADGSDIIIDPTAPDLRASKTNNVGGSVAFGGNWTWRTSVTNKGTAEAVFADGELIFLDDLPNTNISYGPISTLDVVNVTGPGTLSCSYDFAVADAIACYASGGPVTIGAGTGRFDVAITATPSVSGTFDNPRSAGSCKVDPANNVGENDETNNDCSNSVDVAAPTIQSITSSTGNGAYKDGDAIDVTVNFSGNVTLSGGTLDVTLDTNDVVNIAPFNNSSTASGTYTVGAGDTSPDLDSTAISLSGGTLQDAVGNDVTVALPGTTIADGSDIIIDTTAPAPTISATQSDPTNAATLNFSVDFGEVVSGFVIGDLTIGNGTPSNFTTSDNQTFTFDISPTSDGLVTVDIAAGAAQDGAGNDNTAATQFTITSDQTAPPPTISGPTNPTNSDPFDVTIDFGENVNGFETNDITVGNGSISGNLTDNGGGSYTVSIDATADGQVTVDVGAAAAQDGAGNDSTAATQFAVTVDTVAPAPTISGPASPTNSDPFDVTIDFGEGVNNFDSSDITVGNGSVSGSLTDNGGGSYTASIDAIADGQVTVDVGAAAAQDLAGNDNTAATQFSVTVDTTAPTVSISAPSTTLTQNGPVNYDVTYSGADTIDLRNVDITLNRTGTASGSVSVSNGSTSTPTVTISGITGDGTLGISVTAGRGSDNAGNTDAGDGPSTTFNVDNTAPTVVIGAPSASLTQGGPITYDVTYNGADSINLQDGDITLNRTGTANGTVTVTDGSTDTPTVTISAITGDGTLGISVGAGRGSDLAGNTDAGAGPSTTFTVDNTALVPGVPDLADASDTGASNSDDRTKDTTPQFTGTCETGATVTLKSSIDGNLSPTSTCTAGSYDITVTTTLSEGTHDITASQVDLAGNSSGDSAALSIDVIIPTLTVNLAGNVGTDGVDSSTGNPDPGAIDCPTTRCAATFDLDDSVTLDVTVDPASSFDSWSGDCAAFGTATSDSLTLDDDKTCTASFSAADMDVEGNGVSITNGDAIPDAADDTDFGDVTQGSSLDRTFTIQNEGTDTLTLSDHPNAVSLSGSADFTVEVQPASGTIAAGDPDLTFDLRCAPTGTGSRTATVSIANDDPDEAPYTFAVTCNGITPEIEVQRPTGTAINDGDPDALGDQAPSTINLTYTVDNSAGTEQLSITAVTADNLINASGFTLVTPTPIDIAAGATGSFDVSFNVDGVGAFSLDMHIANNDLDEDPYDIQITGTGASVPEIDVLGNDTSIFNGDTTPDPGDHTDFGSADENGATITRTFTIKNLGLADLDLTALPDKVVIGGTHAGDFTLVTDANIPIGGGAESTFAITFDPGAQGLREANITIENNDSDENPYTFNIQGTGTGPAPEMDVLGDNLSIPSGDASPSPADGTDFGSVLLDGGIATHIFTIQNTGSQPLDLTDDPRVTIDGPEASDFTLDVDAATPVPASGGETGFAITFNPGAVGLRQATITIGNTDDDEDPYTYAIQGTGAVPALAGGGEDEADTVSFGCVISAEGGSCSRYPVEVYIPAGAVPHLSQVIIREVPPDSPEANFKLGDRVFDISIKGPDGNWITSFEIPLEIHIRPSDTELSKVAFNYSLLNIFHKHDGSKWNALISSKAEDGCIRTFVNDLSYFALGVAQIPDTGFAPGVVVDLPEQSEAKEYIIFSDVTASEAWQSATLGGDCHTTLRSVRSDTGYVNCLEGTSQLTSDFHLIIPELNIELPIVSVPLTEYGWDVRWLGNQAGHLWGSAFPTLEGNTALTAHVWNADNTPGPFVDLHTLQHGDQVQIQAWGKTYVYEVRAVEKVRSDDLSALPHSEYDILTLITCQGFDESSGEYDWRLVVKAVLVSIQ